MTVLDHTQMDDGGAQLAARLRMEQLLTNYRLTPATLAAKLEPTWRPAHFLQKMSLQIAMEIQMGSGRIIVAAPPRHGKSRLISVFTPIWVLENYPTKTVITTGYGEDLAIEHTRIMKSYIETSQHLLNMRISKTLDRSNEFVIEGGGHYLAVGMGGAITGKGADVLIIDDYIKNPTEAQSQKVRDGHWDWFVTVARTRLEPGATIIIVATRWDIDDLQGRLIALQKRRDRQQLAAATDEEKQLVFKPWTTLDYPAIALANDPLGRKIGEPLFPERYSLNDLLAIKDELGAHWFEAMFQQRPTRGDAHLADSANLIMIHESELPLEHIRMMKKGRAWDLAASEDAGDPTVGTLMWYHPYADKAFIKHVDRKQRSPGDIELNLKVVSDEDHAEYPETQIIIEEEPGSAGKNLIHQFKTNTLKKYAQKVFPSKTSTKKTMRAQPFLAALERKSVYVILTGNQNPSEPDSWPEWVHQLRAELDSFPGGEHDDIVDTCASAYNHLSGKKPMAVTWGRGKLGTLAGVDLSKDATLGTTATQRASGLKGATFGRSKVRGFIAGPKGPNRAVFSLKPRSLS